MLKFVMRQDRDFVNQGFVTNGLLFSSIFIKLKLSLSVCFFLKPRGEGSATLNFDRRDSGIFRNLGLILRFLN